MTRQQLTIEQHVDRAARQQVRPSAEFNDLNVRQRGRAGVGHCGIPDDDVGRGAAIGGIEGLHRGAAVNRDEFLAGDIRRDYNRHCIGRRANRRAIRSDTTALSGHRGDIGRGGGPIGPEVRDGDRSTNRERSREGSKEAQARIIDHNVGQRVKASIANDDHVAEGRIILLWISSIAFESSCCRTVVGGISRADRAGLDTCNQFLDADARATEEARRARRVGSIAAE